MLSFPRRTLAPLLALLTVVLCTPPARAGDPAIPEALRPWVPWVLDGQDALRCPTVEGARRCNWPSRLRLDLDEQGGSFTLDVVAFAPGAVALPGDLARFPTEVRLDGNAAPFARTGDRAAVIVGPGSHRIEGRLSWPRLPESLPVPAEVALVDLVVSGQSVPWPRREADGSLWISTKRADSTTEEALAIDIHRKITDGVPVQVTTRYDFRVSGQARELVVPGPLLPGLVPVSLASDLATQLTAAGELVVQLRPGEWTLVLTARSTGPVVELAAPPLSPVGPAEEYWVFEENPVVRAVRLEGADPVDPQRTSLPEDWRALPAFRMSPAGTLKLVELRRGELEPAPDAVQVERTLWLQQDGGSFVVRDELTGQLNSGGRLDLLAPGTLGRVSVENGNRLVTVGPGGSGVEVRSGSLGAQADSSYPAGADLPAVGWSRDAQALGATVHLPPGWTLIAAPGVDVANGAWLNQWTLWDLFLGLLLVLTTAKVGGRAFGVVMAVLLVLAWHEPAAPRFVWLWILVPALLLPRFSSPRVRRVLSAVWMGGVLLTAIFAFGFARQQIRFGLNPQLEEGGTGAVGQYDNYGDGQKVQGLIEAADAPVAGAAANFEGAPPPQAPAPSSAEESGGSYEPQQLLSRSAPRKKTDGWTKRASRVDAKAVVQTGPGMPRWQWRSHRLEWNGAVAKEHTVRLLLAPPWVDVGLSFIRGLGFLVLLALLVRVRESDGGFRAAATADAPEGDGEPAPTDVPTSAPPASAIAGALVLFLSVALAAPPESFAQDMPSPELLQELKARLERSPHCQGECVEVQRVDLSASGDTVTVRAEVTAQAHSAWALPGPATAWVPARIELDGAAATALRRAENGFVELVLGPGVHTVVLSGPARDTVALQFPVPPRVMRWSGEGWAIEGLRDDVAPSGSVALQRVRTMAPEDGGEATAADGVELPAWLELRRELDVGVPWMVHNELVRLGPPGQAVLARVPLLTGERVTTPGIEVQGIEALVQLERDEESRSWSSTLDEAERVMLSAPTDRAWTERWSLDCSPIWHCSAEGLPPTRHMEEGRWQPLWRPWPGETLTLSFHRPEPAAGSSVTLDAVGLAVVPGRRMEGGSLRLELRASQGADHRVQIPVGAEVQQFLVDGVARPFEVREGAVLFSADPGNHTVDVHWQRDTEEGHIWRSPSVDVGRDAANVAITLDLPEHRWLLWAWGPSWGPVVTFWQHLFVLLLAAFVLGRVAPTPLRTHDWVLLGLGMSQPPVGAAIVVVGWLVMLGLRGRRADLSPAVHNLSQLALIGWTVLAIAMLLWGVYEGLLVAPDMEVRGNGSYGHHLQWYVDRHGSTLPTAGVFTLPLWAYRVLMLLWSMWMARAVLKWFGWGFQQWQVGGHWKEIPRVAPRPVPRPEGPRPPVPPAPPTPPASGTP